MTRPPLLVLASVLALAGCNAPQRLAEIGRGPQLSAIENPTARPDWRPVSMPMPAPQEPLRTANSLWRPGARAFFKDQRAAQVGDIVTVLVSIRDEAQLENSSTRSRNNGESMGLPALLGLESSLTRILPNTINPAELVRASSTGNSTGSGKIDRSETVTLRVAAVVTQVLPNGNLVLAGRQEVRVNNELRELAIQGVIRPQDIASDNTVRHDRMAEARIAYGGRGMISDVQQPRYGQQLLDIILPF
ncbi:MAG: flagellar basal body L-ring protein FlgH [Elioraea sp.]|nr:flagellar basal body L-ring protein FlgH [Elioraea sp.]